MSILNKWIITCNDTFVKFKIKFVRFFFLNIEITKNVVQFCFLLCFIYVFAILYIRNGLIKLLQIQIVIKFVWKIKEIIKKNRKLKLLWKAHV